MSFRDAVRRMLNRAKSEATGVAQTASLKLDIRSLEGRRDHLFREIGKRVYASRDAIGRSAEIDGLCTDIDRVEKDIASRQTDLNAHRSRTDETAEAAPSAG